MVFRCFGVAVLAVLMTQQERVAALRLSGEDGLSATSSGETVENGWSLFGENMNCPSGSHLQYVDCAPQKPANFSPPDSCTASNQDKCMPCQKCRDACINNPKCTRVHYAWKNGSQCNLFSAACKDELVTGHGGLALFNIGTSALFNIADRTTVRVEPRVSGSAR